MCKVNLLRFTFASKRKSQFRIESIDIRIKYDTTKRCIGVTICFFLNRMKAIATTVIQQRIKTTAIATSVLSVTCYLFQDVMTTMRATMVGPAKITDMLHPITIAVAQQFFTLIMHI
jgi:hypothetical protein